VAVTSVSVQYVACNVYCRVNAADVAEYFPYPRVISFLFEFCEKLFDISVKVSERRSIVSYCCRFFAGVATKLENVEYSGISLNMENSGNSHGILCNLREKL